MILLVDIPCGMIPFVDISFSILESLPFLVLVDIPCSMGLLHLWPAKDCSLFEPELPGRNLAAPIGRDE